MKKLFQKGNTASKGKGRPPGSRSMKGTLQAITAKSLLERLPDLNDEYMYMSPSQKLRYFEILLPFATPRLAATQLDQYSHYDDEQLDKAIDGLAGKLLEQKKTIKINARAKIEEAQQS